MTDTTEQLAIAAAALAGLGRMIRTDDLDPDDRRTLGLAVAAIGDGIGDLAFVMDAEEAQ